MTMRFDVFCFKTSVNNEISQQETIDPPSLSRDRRIKKKKLCYFEKLHYFEKHIIKH